MIIKTDLKRYEIEMNFQSAAPKEQLCNLIGLTSIENTLYEHIKCISTHLPDGSFFFNLFKEYSFDYRVGLSSMDTRA